MTPNTTGRELPSSKSLPGAYFAWRLQHHNEFSSSAAQTLGGKPRRAVAASSMRQAEVANRAQVATPKGLFNRATQVLKPAGKATPAEPARPIRFEDACAACADSVDEKVAQLLQGLSDDRETVPAKMPSLTETFAQSLAAVHQAMAPATELGAEPDEVLRASVDLALQHVSPGQLLQLQANLASLARRSPQPVALGEQLGMQRDEEALQQRERSLVQAQYRQVLADAVNVKVEEREHSEAAAQLGPAITELIDIAGRGGDASFKDCSEKMLAVAAAMLVRFNKPAGIVNVHWLLRTHLAAPGITDELVKTLLSKLQDKSVLALAGLGSGHGARISQLASDEESTRRAIAGRSLVDECRELVLWRANAVLNDEGDAREVPPGIAASIIAAGDHLDRLERIPPRRVAVDTELEDLAKGLKDNLASALQAFKLPVALLSPEQLHKLSALLAKLDIHPACDHLQVEMETRRQAMAQPYLKALKAAIDGPLAAKEPDYAAVFECFNTAQLEFITMTGGWATLQGNAMGSREQQSLRLDLTREALRGMSQENLKSLFRKFNLRDSGRLLAQMRLIAQKTGGIAELALLRAAIEQFQALRGAVAEGLGGGFYNELPADSGVPLNHALQPLGVQLNQEGSIDLLGGQADVSVQTDVQANFAALLADVSHLGLQGISMLMDRELSQNDYVIVKKNKERLKLLDNMEQKDGRSPSGAGRSVQAVNLLKKELNLKPAQLATLSRFAHGGAVAGIDRALRQAYTPVRTFTGEPGHFEVGANDQRIRFEMSSQDDGSVHVSCTYTINPTGIVPLGEDRVYPLSDSNAVFSYGIMIRPDGKAVCDPLMFSMQRHLNEWKNATGTNYDVPKTTLEIYDNPELESHLREFANKEHNAENIEFLLSVRGFFERQRRLSPDLVLMEAQQLFHKFVSPAAESMVNINGFTLTKIRQALEELSVANAASNLDKFATLNEHFAAAQVEIHALASADLLSRFRKEMMSGQFRPTGNA